MINGYESVSRYRRGMALVVAAAMCAVLAAPVSVLADVTPRATGVGVVTHLDDPPGKTPNRYVGPLPGGTGVVYGFNDGLNSTEPWLCEFEVVLVGAKASVSFYYPAHTTRMGDYSEAGPEPANGTEFTYAYMAWTQEDEPEMGWSSFAVRNYTASNKYYAIAITEAYSDTGVNVPNQLPPGFDPDLIEANAKPLPLPGPQPNPERSCGIAMPGGVLLIAAPEPSAMGLLLIGGGLAVLRWRRRS